MFIESLKDGEECEELKDVIASRKFEIIIRRVGETSYSRVECVYFVQLFVDLNKRYGEENISPYMIEFI